MAALEAALAVRPTPNLCLVCRKAEMVVTGERPDPLFGVMGLREISLRCPGCGNTSVRQVDPAKP